MRRFYSWLMGGLLITTALVRADEYDTLRQRWSDLQIGPTNLDLADPDVAEHLSTLVSSAQKQWSNMLTGSARTALWSDTAQWANTSAHITISYTRLRTLAQAWATRGSALQGDTNLLAAIIGGLDWLQTNVYNATKTEYDNWWDWEIGTPQALNDTVALVYAQLSAAQRTNYMAAVNKFTPTPNMTAANQVDKALVVALRGILVKDSAKIATARDALSNVFPYVTNGDGFYTDGSFIQHLYHPYTGSYGNVVLGHLVPLLQLLIGSSWQVTDANQTNVVRWAMDSFAPLIYKGAMLDGVRGRAISRQSSTGHAAGADVIATLIRLAQFAPTSDADTLKSLVKYWIQTDTVRDFVGWAALPIVPLAKNILNDAGVVPASEPLGHYHFSSMDRVVHLWPGFGVALSLSSSRIANYESINNENLHGWYTGDGMVYLLNNDLAQFDGDFWPTVNPYRLPGTTVDTQARTNASGQGYLSTNNWVGGAVLGDLGCAGQRLTAWNSTLTAQKSWFLIDDEIICLGANLASSSGRRIETIIENRKLAAGGTNVFLVNGAAQSTSPGWTGILTNTTWAALAGNVAGADIGYYFPQPVTVRALRETRTNAWSNINATGPTSSVSNSFLTLWFDHGINPATATYAYVLLPNRNAAQVAAYAASPASLVLTNANWAQGITNANLGLTAVNFWNDGANSLGGITVDRKAAVITRQSNTIFNVAIADPTQVCSNTINITFNRAVDCLLAADTGVTVVQLAPQLKLAVNVRGARGASFHASFSTVPLPCTLTAQTSPPGRGSVSGGGVYFAGRNATLTAGASNNWVFIGWSGGLTNNPLTIVMPPSNSTYTANFTEVANITVGVNSNAGGSVSGSGLFFVGSNALLRATASNGWRFVRWSDASTNNPRTVAVTSGGASYAATFEQIAVITLQASPANGGSVSGGGVYPPGTNITLRGTPNAGWCFLCWSDGVTNNPRTLTVPLGDTTYVARFGSTVGLGMAVDATNLTWVLGGSTAWAGQMGTTHGTASAAQNGAITAGQQSWFQTTTNGPLSLLFWWKVSSAPTNYLQFYINTQLVSQISGNVNWNQYVTFLGTTNQYTLKWVYTKNSSALSGSDAGFVDQVTVLPCPYATNVPQLFFQDSTGKIASWVVTTNGAFQFARVLANTGGWALKAAGDIDGDGVSDLLFQNAASDTGGWFLNADGSVRDARFWFNIGGWEIKACADYEGTGRAQLFFQTARGDATYWRLDTNGVIQSAVSLGSMGAWKLRGAGDLDGDHKAELFWQNAAGQVVVWYHNTNGTIRSALAFNTGEWALSGVTDVDGDGVCDLIWQTPDSRTGGWFMQTNAVARDARFWWPTGGWKLKAAGR